MNAKRLLVLSLMAIFATSAWAYDFSAVAPSGQTLYYNILDGGSVEVTSQDTIYPYFSTKPTGSLVIPASVTNGVNTYSVTSIGVSAFYGCSGLTSVTIPDGVTSIGNYALCGCSGLTSIAIPDGVTTIGSEAFNGCSGLTSIIIPDGVTSIGNYAFSGCIGLISVTIGNSVTSIGGEAFNGCIGLTTVAFNADSCTSTGSAYVSPFSACTSLTSITFGDNVKLIPDRLCIGLSSLTSVYITNSVAHIGDYAFQNCSGLTSVYIGNSVTLIGVHAFYNCSGLTSMTIPDAITSIGSGAFYNCSGLDTVIMLPVTAPVVGYDCFGFNSTTRKFYIPCGSFDSYYNGTGWSGYLYNYRNYLKEPDPVYTITVGANDSVRGSATSTTVSCAERTIISAMPNYDYAFVQWSNGSTNNPDTLVLTSDSTVTAIFAPNQYYVTGVSSDSIKGSVSGTTLADYLDTVTLTANPNYGYHFVQWHDGNTNNPRRVVAIANILMTAQFGINQYNLTVQADTTMHGGCQGGGSYDYLTSCVVSATANYGYHFTQWSDGVTDNPRTITLTQDTTFTAMFEPNQYAVTGVPSFDVYGMVSGSDTVDYLDTVTLMATPNYGYQFQYWYRDGYYGSVQTNPMQVVASGNIYYTAYFTPMVYTVGTQAEHGSVYIDGTRQYQTQVSLTVTANYGYRFTQWSDGVTDNPRTFTITQDTSFAALFEHNEYTLAFQSADTTKGVVTVASVPGLYLDTTPYVTAAALPHYHFTQWNDGSTENPRRFVFDGDHTYTASFAIDVHTVGVQVDHLAHGTVSGAGSREYGQPITVSATAYSGYQFTHWSDGSTYNPYTFAVLEDKDLTAIFVADGEPWQDTVVLYDTAYVLLHDTTYLNVMVHDTTYITLTDTVTNTVYDTVTNTVYDTVTNMVYDTVDNFIYDTVTIMQYDTVTNTVYDTVDNYIYDTVTVTDTLWLTRTDTLWLHDTVTVHDTVYVTGEGIDGAEALNAKVYSSHGQVVVEGADGHAVALYDVNGRLLLRKEESGERSVFDVTASGTYMIKIGHYPARKVVVIR